MWKLNMEAEVKTIELHGSKIWIIDDVLEEPDLLARFLFARTTAPLQGSPWESNQKLYFKGRYFDFADKAAPIVWLAQNLCKQTIDFYGGFKTNVEGWLDCEDNDYKNYYWFPHIDNGYNCILYLNDNGDTENGTNLYHPKHTQEQWFKDIMDNPRGSDPWISKEKFELVHHLEPKYNRLVLFDGNKFPHGSAVNNKQYFYTDHVTKINPRSHRSNLNFFYHPYGKQEKTDSN